MPSTQHHLALFRAALERALDVSLDEVALRPTAGGCINDAALVDVTTPGGGEETYFAKWNDHALAGQFAAEAKGLEAMRAAGTDLVIPRPIAHADDGPGRSFLVMEYVPPGRPGPGFDAALGRGLAALHQLTNANGFGFDVDGACGATPQPNPWTPDWLTFYGAHRLGHQARLARDDGMARGDVAVLERCIDHLAAHIVDDEPPALIHGDLWSGNLHCTADGRPGLIDPAAYFGHREAELGMMTLFGGFSRAVFDAYEEVRPLRAGWRERNDLYALYHVLNHHHLFGGGYGAQAIRLARKYA